MLFTFISWWMWSVILTGTNQVSAQVVINEVHPYPSTGPEWIELYNNGPEPLILNGWTLRDQLSTPSVIATLDNLVIAPSHYLIIEVINKLNNSGDGVTLLNNLGQTIDSMSFSMSEISKSWSRTPDGTGQFFLWPSTSGATNNVLEPSPSPTLVPTPTPSPTFSPTPLPTTSPSPTSSPEPTNLQISEIMACPSDTDTEWVELYNPNSYQIELEEWKIKDGNNTTRTVSTSLQAYGFGIVSWSSSFLNNTGDSVSLLSPHGHSIVSAQFNGCHSGHSFIHHNGGWQETATPTKQESNIFSDPHPSPSPSLSPSVTPLAHYLPPVVPQRHSTLVLDQSASKSSALVSNSDQGADKKNTLQASNSSSKTLSKANVSPRQPSIEMSQSVTDLRTSSPSKRGIISVIMGSVLLMTGSGYRLYDTFKNFFSDLA